MSKILINKSFRCYTVTPLSIEPNEIIDELCSEFSPTSTRLLTRLAEAIIESGLYMGTRTTSGSGLIPAHSKLYEGGRSTADPPNLATVRSMLEVKVKIDEFQESVEVNDGELRTGHYRFHLPLILRPQIAVLVQSREKLMFMFHGHPIFIPVFLKCMQDMDCATSKIEITGEQIYRALDWSLEADQVDSIGDVKLGYATGTTGMVFKTKDIRKLKSVDEYRDIIQRETAIDVGKLAVSSMECQSYSLWKDGKVLFTDSMSHLGHSRKEEKGDKRLSVWYIIRLLTL